MTQEIDISQLLPSIRTYPFPEKTKSFECPKCMASDHIYNRNKTRLFEMLYCRGNQPPEIEHSTFLGSHTHQITCSPIKEEHFHVHCKICGYVHFIELPVSHG